MNEILINITLKNQAQLFDIRDIIKSNLTKLSYNYNTSERKDFYILTTIIETTQETFKYVLIVNNPAMLKDIRVREFLLEYII